LITNDDGIHSPGLRAAVRALTGLAELLVVAPASPQSSMGRSFGSGPGRGIISEVGLEVAGANVPAYSVTGPPALVVAHALTELTVRPSLCVSGINCGENLGRDVQGSGTVGAAFEAEAYGIPAVAVSLAMAPQAQLSGSFDAVDWTAAMAVTRYFATRIVTEGWPGTATLLNINVPVHPTAPLRWRITRQSSQRYYRAVPPGPRDWSREYALRWTVLDRFDAVERESDIWAVGHDGVVSVTPMTWDQTEPCGWPAEGAVTSG
jgi:5'-nucleotidase